MEALAKKADPYEDIQVLRDLHLNIPHKICTERSEIITKVYKELEGEEIHRKRALALKRILEEMFIFIFDGELIVGNLASGRRSAPIYPEFSWEFIIEQVDDWETRDADRFIVNERDKKKLREITPWWKNRTVRERALAMMPQKVIESIDNGMFSVGNYLNSGIGHVIGDYEKAITWGYRKIIDEVKSKLKQVDYKNPKNVRKKFLYESMVIALEASIAFSKRYEELAKKMAKSEKDERRKNELYRISEICGKVPEFPAETFYEAVQSFWFTHLIFWIESNGSSVSPGRFDQYMYPFYKRDIEQKRITPEEAVKLIACMYVKCSEIFKIYNNTTAKLYGGGYNQGEQLVLGGLNSDGDDATNELSYLCLKAMQEVKMRQPELAARIHTKTSDRFLREAIKTLKMANGQPKFYSDEMAISALLNKGVPIDDARNYGQSGCIETAIPGKTNTYGVAAMTNTGKCLELALFNGIDPVSGKKLGLETGPAENFKTFDDFFDAFKKQYQLLADRMSIATNCIQEAHKELAPQPFLSCFISDCIEKGVDFVEGGARYNFTGPHGVGVGSVADSMAALKKFVFDEKTILMGKMLEALRNNFEGEYEQLRQKLRNKAPHYGVDNPYVDRIARNVAKVHCLAYENFTDPRGSIYAPGFATNTAGVAFGVEVGATPDGRRYGEPLSDGISPVAGRDIEGPTAAMKSVATVDFSLTVQGAIFNLMFTGKTLDSDEKIDKLASLIRGYNDLGGYEVQFNIVDHETLRDAQENPDKYRGLLVRVAGWVAYFVELSKPVQDEIIRRYGHSL